MEGHEGECGEERVPGDSAVVPGPQSCGLSLAGGEMEKKEVLIELLQTEREQAFVVHCESVCVFGV